MLQIYLPTVLGSRQRLDCQRLDPLHRNPTPQRRPRWRPRRRPAVVRVRDCCLPEKVRPSKIGLGVFCRIAGDDASLLRCPSGRRGLRLTRVIAHSGFLGGGGVGECARAALSGAGKKKEGGLDPEAYLADVIDRMAKGHPINRLGELLPWNWTRQAVKLAA